MNRLRKHWALTTVLLLVAVITAAQTLTDPKIMEIRRGLLADRPATAPIGTIFAQLSGANPPDPDLFVYLSTGWTQLYFGAENPSFANVTATGTLDVTGVTTLTGALNSNNATLGTDNDDDVTINAPVALEVYREDFYGHGFLAVEEDFTAAVVTDASENMLLMPGALGLIHFRYEAPGGPGFAGTLAPLDGQALDLDGMKDAVDNEGVDLTFGSAPDTSAGVCDEDLITASVGCYAEVSVTIADISEVDIFHFGFRLSAAYVDAGAHATYDTYAFFILSDALGDLDIVTELNGGGVLNDDTGTTWADGATHVLRVVVFADTVQFWLNGTQITQVNAVLNLDATDELVVSMGTVNATGDATPAPGIRVNYVEYGKHQ